MFTTPLLPLNDLYMGVPPWREWFVCNVWPQRRQKGIWDPNLQRQTFVLSDNRCLSYFVDRPSLGDSDVSKLPHIFVFHAMFLTGNAFLLRQAPKDYVLVCINRPGYFGSDAPSPLPGHYPYSYRQFAQDVEELANYLQLDEFYVAGHSSGGPCALACAAHLGTRRVRAVGLLSGDPEYAHHAVPKKHWTNDWLVGKFLPFLLQWILCCLPMARMAQGLQNDYRLETSPYSFRTEDVQQPALIHVGERDSILPPHLSRHVHARLDHAQLVILPGIGHLSLLRDQVLEPFFLALIALGQTQPNGVNKKDEIQEEMIQDTSVPQEQLIHHVHKLEVV